jgi:hypothetical protein
MSSYGAKGTRTPNHRLQRTAAEPERSLAWRRAAMAEINGAVHELIGKGQTQRGHFYISPQRGHFYISRNARRSRKSFSCLKRGHLCSTRERVGLGNGATLGLVCSYTMREMQPPRDSQPKGEKWKRFQAAETSISGDRSGISTTKPRPMARRSSGAAKAAVGDSRGVRTRAIAAVEREESVVAGGASRIQSPRRSGSGDVLKHHVGSETPQ